MLVVVEVCDVNSASALDLESLEATYPGVSVIRNPCLSHCAQCAVAPFAYVNGELLTGTNQETLWSDLKAAVETELKNWESDM